MSNQALPLTNIAAVTTSDGTDEPSRRKNADSLESTIDAAHGVGGVGGIEVTPQWHVRSSERDV